MTDQHFSQETIDAVGAKTGAVITYSGSAGTVVAGLSLNEWGVVVGIITAILGLAIQFWFKWREDQRQALYWSEKMRGEE